MNTGTQLWEEAKIIIPGGNQLLSKRSEMFLPGQWPSYYKKAKGCMVWDLDGRSYYDLSQMGVCSCVIGYADEEIDGKVKLAIDEGTMTTLNCWEEVALAKKLISLHSWSEMIRFARTGGEGCAIAVRIARAAMGKDKIAFCGYHGWHDWYLSSNLSDKNNLDEQLLPGLEPKGVPRGLKGTAFPFRYNALKELEDIVEKNNGEIAAIVMEVVRSVEPVKGFLEGVRKIASAIGAVLIFDEVTSGFRMNVGGAHLLYQVEPDIAIFGKALGNGYPICAVLGKRKYMEAARDSFISSTFWTERIGFVAGLAVIEKMERCHVPEKLMEYGETIRKGLKEHAASAHIPLKLSGIKSLLYLSFDHPQSTAMQTFYTQEMLKRGFLVGSVLCPTYALSIEIIQEFLNHAHDIFRQMARTLNEGGDIVDLLEGPVRHIGFKRLTD